MRRYYKYLSHYQHDQGDMKANARSATYTLLFRSTIVRLTFACSEQYCIEERSMRKKDNILDALALVFL